MRKYQTEITLDLLKNNNKTFFDNATFHKDEGYGILYYKGKRLLAVKTKLTGVVYYLIDNDTFRLTHTTLQEHD